MRLGSWKDSEGARLSLAAECMVKCGRDRLLNWNGEQRIRSFLILQGLLRLRSVRSRSRVLTSQVRDAACHFQRACTRRSERAVYQLARSIQWLAESGQDVIKSLKLSSDCCGVRRRLWVFLWTNADCGHRHQIGNQESIPRRSMPAAMTIRHGGSPQWCRIGRPYHSNNFVDGQHVKARRSCPASVREWGGRRDCCCFASKRDPAHGQHHFFSGIVTSHLRPWQNPPAAYLSLTSATPCGFCCTLSEPLLPSPNRRPPPASGSSRNGKSTRERAQRQSLSQWYAHIRLLPRRH